MTFDADIPELAFGNGQPRLQIGCKYPITNSDGTQTVAKLLSAHVLKQSKKAFGICVTDTGENVFAEFPLTEDELAGYERHPDTFFGRFEPNVKPINDALKMYDWFYERYGELEKAKLLDLMKEASAHLENGLWCSPHRQHPPIHPTQLRIHQIPVQRRVYPNGIYPPTTINAGSRA